MYQLSSNAIYNYHIPKDIIRGAAL